MSSPFSVPFLAKLQTEYQFVLASGSPRRQDILRNLDIDFEVVVSEFPENLDKSQFADPGDYVSENAKLKALDVYHRLRKRETDQPYLIIGADTVVYADQTILEKPRDDEEALAALRSYGRQPHQVITAICLLGTHPSTEPGQYFCYGAVERTEVVFDPHIPDEALQAYVNTGEPQDKAGSYGYQGLAAFFISRINGDYYNVVSRANLILLFIYIYIYVCVCLLIFILIYRE
ncbi:inosine triphosphate pyrophosphatase-like protein [Dimargaris cristalligena]|uniref:Inosine triphosphate pyrophosphatase-like protein n=1 Tax=Dimargaris cristalligena TaxID=215637 RepID=A0A4P9ZUE9_9FUNG|nr:inosine triphosphate pyrophosphatase-like protein [Dimargaris cristalligena]|eukprot:RKP36501.1 inosine triphosphate pyrophosphatase-like protein [Dimargaris cristalligena]